MSEKRARRVSALVTVVAVVYFFWKLISAFGVAGIVGSLLSLAFVTIVFVVISRRR